MALSSESSPSASADKIASDYSDVAAGPGTLVPATDPSQSNESAYLDDFAADTWPSAAYTSTGTAISPSKVSGMSAFSWALSSGNRVEVRPNTAASRLDSEGSESVLWARVSASSSQEVLLGWTNVQSDTMGTSPTDGVWIRRTSGGTCYLRVAKASSVSEVALAFPLPTDGYFDLSLRVRTTMFGIIEAIAYVAGVPAGVLADIEAPTGWLTPRVAVSGAGTLSLDRLARTTLGLATGELL